MDPDSLPERRAAVRASVVLSDILDDEWTDLKCCSCSDPSCSFHRNLDPVYVAPPTNKPTTTDAVRAEQQTRKCRGEAAIEAIREKRDPKGNSIQTCTNPCQRTQAYPSPHDHTATRPTA